MMQLCGIPIAVYSRYRIKGEEIDFDSLDTSNAISFIDNGHTYCLLGLFKGNGTLYIYIYTLYESGGHKIYFSTDAVMSGKDIVEYYRTRFQIEFCFRDSKQFTGLNHCQARSLEKLDFAFKASLAAVNVAKVVRTRYYPSLSIGLLKSCMSNIYILKRILARSGLRPNNTLNAKLVKELFGFVADAA